ncbi:hypothetical protein OG607_16270 [Streptomyces sp. NBC_01537]|uniref:hypothetical protein n=1 Tax=Streptomyces sp. NBC_01537 TaxID=2903896 RepID=UPI00386B3EBD
MGVRWRAKDGSTPLAAVIAVCIALTLTGCGGGGGGKKNNGASQTTSSAAQKTAGSGGTSSSPTADSTQTLAQIKGPDDITVTINSATRDSGGFVTVSGTLTNNGSKFFSAINWKGTEVAIQKSGPSVAGAVLVDEAGKKRYYVLRDTEGKCLCTMGLNYVKPGATVPIFAQFPAPPESTTQVQFQLPTMPPASIEISDSEG